MILGQGRDTVSTSLGLSKEYIDGLNSNINMEAVDIAAAGPQDYLSVNKFGIVSYNKKIEGLEGDLMINEEDIYPKGMSHQKEHIQVTFPSLKFISQSFIPATLNSYHYQL